jgi:hypothetical protein
LQALYPTEGKCQSILKRNLVSWINLLTCVVLSFENRAKGGALVGWASSAFSLINTFGLPDALKALGWKSE